MADCLECILGGLDLDCECTYCESERCEDWCDTLADCDAGDCVDFCTCSGDCCDSMAKADGVSTEGYASMNTREATGLGAVPVVPVAVNFSSGGCNRQL
ncbi:hypothetical protein V7S43_012142 [Phytophthora oleae]|uniref:SMB domain-containing protein n=1 Tax=Phytophthora oleae TaxID=2107226 RepID=A0ABD3FB58_9STRA